MNSENNPIPESNSPVNDDVQDLADSDNNAADSTKVIESTTKPVNSGKIIAETTDIWADDTEVSSTVTASEVAPKEASDSESEEVVTDELIETLNPTQLVADSWLEEETVSEQSDIEETKPESTSDDLATLKQQKANLKKEIQKLQNQKETLVLQQLRETQETIGRMVEEGMKELKSRKNELLIDIEKLERRRERIRQEMKTTFAGSSQDLAVRIQGFKEYLVGSLQDLATAAEQLKLPSVEPRPQSREPRRSRSAEPRKAPEAQFTERAFAEQTRKIRQILEQYRTRPDYYGSPWQLRRTFEPIHAEKVQDWFFTQGGRGAIKGMDSRLQNILIASAIVSVLHRLYGDRCRNLILVDTPEKLGEWRRGLQDCLGISQTDFRSDRGVVLFDSPEVLEQRAERLLKDKLLPLIIIDDSEGLINLSLLRFPLWLAFTQEPRSNQSGYLY